MTPLLETVPWYTEAVNSLQAATFAALGIMVILGSVWQAFGKSLYKRIIGWFEKLESRFDVIDEKQQEAQIERETERRASELRDLTITQKLDQLSSDLRTVSVTVADHHAALYGSGSRSGLIEEMAYFRGQQNRAAGRPVPTEPTE